MVLTGRKLVCRCRTMATACRRAICEITRLCRAYDVLIRCAHDPEALRRARSRARNAGCRSTASSVCLQPCKPVDVQNKLSGSHCMS